MKRTIYVILALLAGTMCFAGPKIYINPGHGGYNSNDRNIVTINHASGDHDGFWESQANLTKGLYLRDMLQAAGATVYMSRTDNRSGYRDDTSISNTIGDRPLSTIAKEASNKADFFLSIHSNASGNSTSSATNYLLLMLTGKSGSGDWGASFNSSEAQTAANAAWSRLSANSETEWTSTNKRVMSFTSYTVISPSYLTIPGYLSEGEFHDYKPEAHRLLNDDYCKLEAYRFLQAFCDYYSSSLTRPTTGVICGDVRDASETMDAETLYQKAIGKDVYKPLNGAKVKLMKDGDVIATYSCDDEWNGFYAFWDVAPGTYQVQCAAADHASVTNSVTVSAATISYNNVQLGSGSGDGMEDVTVELLGVLYDTLIDQSAANWLEEKTIRRAVVKGEKLYVLTNESRLFAVNAATGELIRELSTEGISVSNDNSFTKKVNDIALTEDKVLLGCQLEQTTSSLTNYWQVYTWVTDADNPTVFRQSKTTNTCGNLYTANTGYTFCVQGTSTNYGIYTLTRNPGTTSTYSYRVVFCDADNTKYSKNDGKLTTATLSEDARMIASPYGSDQFILEGASMHPTLYKCTWGGGTMEVNVATLSLPDVRLSGGTFVTYAGHTLYITPYGSENVGVGVYEATSGLSSASLLKTLYPETLLTLADAGYMTSAAEADGEELVVTLYVQGRGISRWRLSRKELETTEPVVIEPEEVVEGANIYASELKLSESGNGKFIFSYRLNADAIDVELQMLYEGEVIQIFDFGAQKQGIQSGSITKESINFPTRKTDDHLTWAIKATGKAINKLTKLSNDETRYQFYRPFGVAVDNNPESEFFGRVYVTNTNNGTCSGGRTTANGLFAFDAGLNALKEEAFDDGVTWGVTNSPFRLAVAEDGRVFLCDWSDGHSGIWIAPPGGITGEFTELFAGLTRENGGLASNGSVAVHGSISGCWVEGSGAETKLYTMDEDYTVDGVAGNMLRYDIGTSTIWQDAPSAVAFANKSNGQPLVNMTLKMVADKKGGWWIVQYRYAENSKEPSLIHVRNGAIDYNTGGEQLLDNSRNGGLAVNYDGTRIATTSQSQINVWNVTYDANGAFESIVPAFEITANDISGLGTSSNDVAFDPAGNVYYVSNTSERLVVIGLPKADNSFVTPARSIYTISLPTEPITPMMEVKVTEWEADGLTVDFGEAPSATGVVVTLEGEQTGTLTLEKLYAHTSSGEKVTINDKHITLPKVINLLGNYGKKLTLTWMKVDEVIGITEVDVPIIIASNGVYSAQYWTNNHDVVVLQDATLTLNLSNTKQLRSLEIYPGGKVIVNSGTLTVMNLILRYGWTRAHTNLSAPKLVIGNGASMAQTNAYLDCVIDYAQYYPFAVPYEVMWNKISYRDYPLEPVAGNVLLKQYDGEQRATGVLGSNWKLVSPETLKPTEGYALAAKRPDDVMFSVVRMPLDMSMTQNTASITAYGTGTGTWNNVGWNFIANPYLQTFAGTTATEFGVRYATIPNADFQDYYQMPIDEAQLEPMSPFFVQTGTDTEITFAAMHLNATLTPARRGYGLAMTDLRLRFCGNGGFDQTYVLLGETFTDEPDFDGDLPKEFGRAPKIWSVNGEDALASIALPGNRTEYTIALAMQTDIAGEFILTLSDKSVLGDVERVELLEDGVVVADLMTEDYFAELPKGTTVGRFELHIVRLNQVTTDNEENMRIEDRRRGSVKRLENQRVVIDFEGHTFDMLGGEVEYSMPEK